MMNRKVARSGLVCLGVLLLSSGPGFAKGPAGGSHARPGGGATGEAAGDLSPRQKHELASDHRDVKRDKLDIAKDHKDLAQDRKDLHGDHSQVKADRQNVAKLLADMKSNPANAANDKAAIQDALKNLRKLQVDEAHDRRDIRLDERDLHKDRRDLHLDKVDLRNDVAKTGEFKKSVPPLTGGN